MDLPASLSLSKLTNTKLGEEDPSQTLKPSLQGEVWLQLPQCPMLYRGCFCVYGCMRGVSLPLTKAFLHLLILSAGSDTFPWCSLLQWWFFLPSVSWLTEKKSSVMVQTAPHVLSTEKKTTPLVHRKFLPMSSFPFSVPFYHTHVLIPEYLMEQNAVTKV